MVRRQSVEEPKRLEVGVGSWSHEGVGQTVRLQSVGKRSTIGSGQRSQCTGTRRYVQNPQGRPSQLQE